MFAPSLVVFGNGVYLHLLMRRASDLRGHARQTRGVLKPPPCRQLQNGPLTVPGPRRKLPSGSVVRGLCQSLGPSLPTHRWTRDIRVSTRLYRLDAASRTFAATTATIPPVSASEEITRTGASASTTLVIE